MDDIRPYAESLERLKQANLRPTRQRLALGKMLFTQGPRHVTAEQLHNEALEAGVRVSLATVYNALNQFTATGLLREVVVDPTRAYFDTNTGDHHHFYFEETGELRDIEADEFGVATLPPAPEGTTVERVDVVIRVRGSSRN
jgi:Fur family iron response transcriptional regulator